MFKDFSGGSGDDYLKFKDGTAYKGVFRGDAHEYYAVFKDRTEYQSYAPGRSYKFKVNFLVQEDGEWVAKILQGGRKLQGQINSEVEEGGFDKLYRVKRTGASKDNTVYSCSPAGDVSEEDLEKIKCVTLKKFTTGRKVEEDEIPSPTDADFNPETDVPKDEEIPF